MTPEPESEPEQKQDLELEPEPVQDLESDDEPEPESVPRQDHESEPEPDHEPGWEQDPEPDHEPEPESQWDSEPEQEVEPEWNPKPGQYGFDETSPNPYISPDIDLDIDFDSEPDQYDFDETPPNPYPDPAPSESSPSYESDSQAPDESETSAPRRLPRIAQTFLDHARSDRRFMLVVLALLAVLVSVFGIAQITSCVRTWGERARIAAEQRRLGSPIDQEVTVVVANYDADHGTPIPLHVVGDAKNGTHVDETMTADVRDPKLPLLPGTYVITAGGSLATDQGAFYHGTIDSYTVVVRDKESADGSGNDSAADGEGAHSATNPVFAYELVAPEHVTDADIEALRAWMSATNVQDSQRYVDAVTASRAAAQQRIAEESAARDEEERQRTEETAREVEEALQSNAQVGTDRVSFVLPDSWRGRVQTSQTTGASGYAITIVHLPGNQYAELARVFFSAGYVGTGADGTLRHVASWRSSYDGTGHAEVQTLNWPLIAAMGAESQYGVTQSELYELVSLSSGGAVSADYARYAGGYDTSVSQAEPNFSAVAFSSLAAI